MVINKAKASSYNDMTGKAIAYDARFNLGSINHMMADERIDCIDRTQLKAIAAELETVQKRLKYCLYGQY